MGQVKVFGDCFCFGCLSISDSLGYPVFCLFFPLSQALERRVSVTVFFGDREREGSLGPEELETCVDSLRLSGTSSLLCQGGLC